MRKTLNVCDRCRKPIETDFALAEQCLGDGNAYRIQLLINEIDANGWREGEFHARCLAELVEQLTRAAEDQRLADA